MANSPKDHRGSKLAQRLRLNMTKKAAALREEEEKKARTLQDALRERVTLMSDLKAFGEAAGFVVRTPKQHVVFQMGDQTLDFDGSNEDGTVQLVETPEAPIRFSLLFEHRLKKWVLVLRRKKGSDEQLVLFDTGLEVLIDSVFEIEAVDEDEWLEAQRQNQPENKTPKRSL